jgi:5-methylcytosine-specific restriction endonuclease McrA
LSEDTNGAQLTLLPTANTQLVTRSSVAPGKPYKEYRQYLRRDFFFSCAYCTMSESEALAIRMTIDHYEPRKARPDLENIYGNLMYACDECNRRKGDRYPPPEARAGGHRFFRPDEDIRNEHFDRNGIRVEPRTPVGDYSIKTLDLNRKALRRLREIRHRLAQCEIYASEGVFGLRRFHIDQLPKEIKGSAARAIRDAASAQALIVSKIDNILLNHARSPLIDPDPEAEALDRQRRAELKEIEALFPGKWRGDRKKRR